VGESYRQLEYATAITSHETPHSAYTCFFRDGTVQLYIDKLVAVGLLIVYSGGKAEDWSLCIGRIVATRWCGCGVKVTILSVSTIMQRK